MYASDVEQSDSARTGDQSNATTDDEFFNELMEAPPEFEDCLIPDQCKHEVEGIEHLTKCLNRRFNAYPVVFMGTLKEALKEAFSQKEITERRPLLIYVNNDKSVLTNVFCKQLLCNEKVIDYLMNNYVLWAWDVTFESNTHKLNDMCKTLFPPWTHEKQFQGDSIDQYPLLIGIQRDTNGDHTFTRLIEGATKKPNLNEFLGILSEFKEHFDTSEKEYEKAREDAKQQMIMNLFQAHDIHHRSKRHHERDYVRSISMFPHRNYNEHTDSHHAQFSRLLSGNIGVKPYSNEYYSPNPVTKEDIIHAFERFNMDPDDADDEDDERTPTVERPAPKFP